MSQPALETSYVYRIPHLSSMVLEGPEYLPQVRESLRMVLEDDVWNAAARGEASASIPPLRASVPLNTLKRSGVAMPGAASLGEAQLTEQLWAVIRGMSTLGIFIEGTDRLTDRELYGELRERLLRTKAIIAPSVVGFSCTFKLSGKGLKVADRDRILPQPERAGSRVLPPPS